MCKTGTVVQISPYLSLLVRQLFLSLTVWIVHSKLIFFKGKSRIFLN